VAGGAQGLQGGACKRLRLRILFYVSRGNLKTSPIGEAISSRLPDRPRGCGNVAPVHEQDFEILSEIVAVDIIAVGGSIRDLRRLQESYGDGRWRKLKGMATVRFGNGRVRRAELHWYEAHGIGKRDFKIKRYLD
jgi:hypothetical protein